MRRWLLSATCWMCEYPAKAGASHCKMPQNRWFFGRWGKTQSRAASLTCPCLHRLRSGYSTKDYSLTGLVWSAVNLSPEQLGHGVSLKVTVVCDSLREPLTFTCDCKCPTPCSCLQQLGGEPQQPPGEGSGGGSHHPRGSQCCPFSPQAPPPWTCSSTRHCATHTTSCTLLTSRTLSSRSAAWRSSCRSEY